MGLDQLPTRQFVFNRAERNCLSQQAYEQMGFTYVHLKHHRGRHIEVVGTIGNETIASDRYRSGEHDDHGCHRQKEKIPFTDERLSLVGISLIFKKRRFPPELFQFSSR